MKAVGIIVVVLGVLVLLAGLGMDTTRTTITCYEADYAWDAADSTGCIETTYSNPAPKIATMMFGFGMVIGGGVLAGWSNDTESTDDTPVENHREGGTSASDNTSTTFAEKLQERQHQKDSE